MRAVADLAATTAAERAIAAGLVDLATWQRVVSGADDELYAGWRGIPADDISLWKRTLFASQLAADEADKLTRTEVGVALTVAEYANKSWQGRMCGLTSPGQQTTARVVAVSTKTVQRAWDRLADLGWLVRYRPHAKGRASEFYLAIPFALVPGCSPFLTGQASNWEGVHGGSGHVGPSDPPPADVPATPPPPDPSPDASVHPTAPRQHPSAGGDVPADMGVYSTATGATEVVWVDSSGGSVDTASPVEWTPDVHSPASPSPTLPPPSGARPPRQMAFLGPVAPLGTAEEEDHPVTTSPPGPDAGTTPAPDGRQLLTDALRGRDGAQVAVAAQPPHAVAVVERVRDLHGASAVTVALQQMPTSTSNLTNLLTTHILTHLADRARTAAAAMQATAARHTLGQTGSALLARYAALFASKAAAARQTVASLDFDERARLEETYATAVGIPPRVVRSDGVDEVGFGMWLQGEGEPWPNPAEVSVLDGDQLEVIADLLDRHDAAQAC